MRLLLLTLALALLVPVASAGIDSGSTVLDERDGSATYADLWLSRDGTEVARVSAGGSDGATSDRTHTTEEAPIDGGTRTTYNSTERTSSHWSREASVTTGGDGLVLQNGCSGRSTYDSSITREERENDSRAASQESRSRQDTCATSAEATVGAVTLQAAREEHCEATGEREGSSLANESHKGYDWGERRQESCRSGVRAEDVWVGSTRTCAERRSESLHERPRPSSQKDHVWSCNERHGADGPTGLSVGASERSGRSLHCWSQDDASSCWESRGHALILEASWRHHPTGPWAADAWAPLP